MKLKYIDHIGVIVNDLEPAKQFFTDLGFTIQGEDEEQTAPHAVATAAADLASVIHAAAIVTYTSSGTTAARVARKRPSLPILAITPSREVSRRLCLLWGAHSVLSEDVRSYEEMVEHATALALAEEFASSRDLLVVVAGIPFAQAGTTNNLRVVSLP